MAHGASVWPYSVHRLNQFNRDPNQSQTIYAKRNQLAKNECGDPWLVRLIRQMISAVRSNFVLVE